MKRRMVTMIKRAGKTAIQGACSIKVRASDSMEPQEGSGGWMPRPRKLMDASVRMALERARVA